VGQLGSEHHAHGDRLAVAQPEAVNPLERMTEGVTVVECFPADPATDAGLEQVDLDGGRLDGDALRDQLREEARRGVQHTVGRRLDELENLRVRDESALHDLGHTAAQLLGRQ
jgi:hypothetical protein